MVLVTLIGIGFFLFVVSSLKVVNQYNLGIKFTLGKFTGVMQPGLRLVIPFLHSWEKVDMRVRILNIPEQDSITKDNVNVKVSAVIHFIVENAKNVILGVENYVYATSQLSQTTLRDVIGQSNLDELLINRNIISQKIQNILEKSTNEWGIKVKSVYLKHVDLPYNMKKNMIKETQAEIEKRAIIIKSEGEKHASKNFSHAAKILSNSPGAFHLRTLHSSNNSNNPISGFQNEFLEIFDKNQNKEKTEKNQSYL